MTEEDEWDDYWDADRRRFEREHPTATAVQVLVACVARLSRAASATAADGGESQH